ncbi:MAG: hypothetical protein HQM04_17765 [Magnetococcales bacterium]|nr:hypothetical protein [Magnetococcales bacterium]MBF0116877.1 hypothetical protein [Magnetococcales bacterium]
MDESAVGNLELTEKQRFWLEHWQRCRSSGDTIKNYALTHELSLPAMYFWRRELALRGLLDLSQRANRSEGRGGERQPHGFKKLVVLSGTRPAPCRILLPNGVAVEWADCSPDQAESLLRMAASLP